MIGGERRRTYFECRVGWVFLADSRIDPCGMAAFNGEHGGARCSVSLGCMGILKIFNKELRTLL